jgi:DNA polymerase-3 subunit epsilon
MLHAMAHTGMDLEACIARVRQQPVSSAPIAQQGDPTGYLFGEEIVFTGALTMLRAEAAACAARVGCSVANTVRKTTTMLVVGDQDVTRCAGHTKSTKHRKAEEANKKGQSIRILRDSDFLSLVTAYATEEAA